MRDIYIRRIELVISTGMPGLYRLITYLAIQHIYSMADLGRVASSMAIAQIAGFFSAIGWATLILVRVSGAKNIDEAKSKFYNVSWMALCVTVLVSLLMMALIQLRLLSFDVTGVLELLWAWTAYQLFRHFFVAQKRYAILILFDGVLITASIAAVWIAREIRATPADALSISLFCISLWMVISIGYPSGGVKISSFDKKGLEFGLANFVSGGMMLSLSPMAVSLCGPAFAGVFSLINSVSTFGALLPRAISLSQLPVLSKKRASRESLREIVRKMRNNVILVNIIVLAGSVVASVGVILVRKPPGITQESAIGLVILMATLYTVGSSAITHSNILMIFERSMAGLVINTQSAVVFFVVSLCVIWAASSTGFWILLVAAICVTIQKNFLIVRVAFRAILSYERARTEA